MFKILENGKIAEKAALITYKDLKQFQENPVHRVFFPGEDTHPYWGVFEVNGYYTIKKTAGLELLSREGYISTTPHDPVLLALFTTEKKAYEYYMYYLRKPWDMLFTTKTWTYADGTTEEGTQFMKWAEVREKLEKDLD